MNEKLQGVDQARVEIPAALPESDQGNKVGESCCAIAPGTPLPSGEAKAPVETPMKSGWIAGFLKMAACCGGMLLLLPALGLVNLGGLAAVGGSLLSIAAVLACPIGMYFMMRGMMKQEQGGSPAEQKKQLSDDTVNQGVKR
jgi:hypothetical protein